MKFIICFLAMLPLYYNTMIFSSENDSNSIEIILAQECNECMIGFFDSSKEMLQRERLPDGGDDSLLFAIPEEASSFSVWNHEIGLILWVLPKDDSKKCYEFNYKRNYLSDLMSGSGDSRAKPFSPIITTTACTSPK